MAMETEFFQVLFDLFEFKQLGFPLVNVVFCNDSEHQYKDERILTAFTVHSRTVYDTFFARDEFPQ